MFDSFIRQALEALAAAIGAGLVALIVRTLQRIGLRLTAEHEAKLAYYAQQAIAYAEEAIEAKAKQAAGKVENKARLKLQEAIAFLVGKLPGLTSGEAVEAITSGLGASPFGASKPVSW